MIKLRLKKLKDQFVKYNLDGYVVPKNDEFFSEYSIKDRLAFISNFKGSAGCAVILKNKNYLFVDGRYTIQANIESGKNFRIIDYKKIPKHKNWPGGDVWDKYYFFGGEDYELVFSLPTKWAKNLINLDNTISEIGYFTEGSPSVEFNNLKNNKFLQYKSFTHF